MKFNEMVRNLARPRFDKNFKYKIGNDEYETVITNQNIDRSKFTKTTTKYKNKNFDRKRKYYLQCKRQLKFEGWCRYLSCFKYNECRQKFNSRQVDL